jgi:hypothetical protein
MGDRLNKIFLLVLIALVFGIIIGNDTTRNSILSKISSNNDVTGNVITKKITSSNTTTYNDVINKITSNVADNQVYECQQDFEKYAKIGEEKTESSIKLLNIKKITDHESAKEFYDTYSLLSIPLNDKKECSNEEKYINCDEDAGVFNLFDDKCCTYYKNDFPFVFIGVSKSIDDNHVPMVLICGKDGKLSKYSKYFLLN